MKQKKLILLTLFWGIALCVYSQSGLVNAAAKGIKAAGSAKVEKKASTPPKPKTSSKGKGTSTKYQSVGYMEITGISFANVDYSGNIIDNYGARLHANETKYLKPQLTYNGLADSSQKITLDVKIIKEDGTLVSGKSSPEGFSFSEEVTVEPGKGKVMAIMGWGNNSAKVYSAELYKFEIWYKGNLLIAKDFRLYSGSTPLVNSPLVRINEVKFGNVDVDGNILSEFGSSLFEGEAQYIKPKIYYEGLYANDQKVSFNIRIFLASGDMAHGSISPLGYTFRTEATIKPGSNTITLSGWGNEAKTLYKEGIHKFEIWMDGEKIYETTFNVLKAGS